MDDALFQSRQWGEVQKRLGLPVWRFEFFDGKKKIGCAQVVKVTAKRGTFLHVRHGPLLLSYSPRTLHKVMQEVLPLAKKEHCWFLRMSPLIEDSEKNRKLFASIGARPSPIHAMDGEICWVLDLDKSEDEILAGMRKTTRHEIKKAMSVGVEVKDSRDIGKFLELYKETATRQGFVEHKGIREEFDVFSKHAQLLLGYYQNKLLAGALILYWGGQAIYHHGASIRSQIPVSHLLQWIAINEAKKRGMKRYNFWGIAPEGMSHHPWQGITLFKKGFGGREIQYLHSQDIPISPLYAISYAIESVRRVVKGYS